MRDERRGEIRGQKRGSRKEGEKVVPVRSKTKCFHTLCKSRFKSGTRLLKEVTHL